MTDSADKLDFSRFHREQLPQALTDLGNSLAGAAAAHLPPLAFKLTDREECFTYYPHNNEIQVRSGLAQAHTVVELDPELWLGLATDLETVPGLLYGGRLGAGTHGDMGVFSRWEPVLRAVYHNLPICDPNSTELQDSRGRKLDPHLSFTLDDAIEPMREFLDSAGYLLVNSVFDESELQIFRQQALELRDEARPGDKVSWWGKNAAGAEICTRVLTAIRKPAFAHLYEDPRIIRLQQVVPAGLEPRYNSEQDAADAITIVYKTPTMTEGLSDLPWHRDCGMGGHAIMCPAINVSIYLQDATAESGELRFLPGSHRTSCGNLDGDRRFGVAVAAKAGAVTLHYTDVMHAAPPPSPDCAQLRSSLLLGFARIKGTHRGERHYNDVLFRSDDGQIEHMDSLLQES